MDNSKKKVSISYKRYLRFLLALVLIAISYNLFIIPINLVAGGAGGLGVLFNNLFGINPSFIIFIVSFITFILAYIFLDLDQACSTLFVAAFYPVLVRVTSNVSDIFVIDTHHVLLMVLFGAILTGIGQGLIFKENLNIGGFSVFVFFFYKYTNISVTYTNAFMNGIVIILGAFFIKFSMILYAILFIFILRYVSERIILGVSSNKTFKIISSKYQRIEKYIHSLGHDVTIYDTVGAYKGGDAKLLMTVVPTSEFILLRDYVRSVDTKAFIFVTNTYEVGMQDYSIRKGTK